jgi:hypothetical protein
VPHFGIFFSQTHLVALPQTNLVETNAQNYKRKTKRNMDRRGRFRTQPITFMEIQVRFCFQIKEGRFFSTGYGTYGKIEQAQIGEKFLLSPLKKNCLYENCFQLRP